MSSQTSFVIQQIRKQVIEKEQLNERIKRKDIPLVRIKNVLKPNQETSENNYPLHDVDGVRFGVGDFVEHRFVVNGHISEYPRDNISLIVGVKPEIDCIFSVGRTDAQSGISTNTLEHIRDHTTGYKKLNSEAVKRDFPEVYEIIKRRAAAQGFSFKP